MAQRKEELEKPNYYAVIPASVRYDSKLPKGAILLYGEITALSHKDGTSWATDSYFMRLYGVGKSTIQRWLTALEDQHYITRRVVYKTDKRTIERRYIRATILPDDATAVMPPGGIPKNGYRSRNGEKPTGTKDSTPPIPKNGHTPYTQKRAYPIPKNGTDNNTSINNKTPLVVQVIEYLNQVAGKKFDPKKDAARKPVMARLNEPGNQYTLEDFKRVIDNKTAEWTGQVSSSGKPMTNFLKPDTLFSKSHFENYLNEAPAKPLHSEPPAPEDPQARLRGYVGQQVQLYGGLSATDAAAMIVNGLSDTDIQVDPQQVLAIVQEYRKTGDTDAAKHRE